MKEEKGSHSVGDFQKDEQSLSLDLTVKLMAVKILWKVMSDITQKTQGNKAY